MSQPFHIAITHKRTGERSVKAGEFGDDDWALLRRFADCARDLLNTRFVRDGMPAQYVIGVSRERGFFSDSELPDRDDFSAFLHRLRPIYLQNEPTNFNRVCNILTRYVDLPGFRHTIGKQRDIYALKRHAGLCQIEANGLLLNSTTALDRWLNGFEYHRDEKKRSQLEAAHSVFPLESSVALFVDMLRDMTEAIAAVLAVIGAFERRSNTVVDVESLNSF